MEPQMPLSPRWRWKIERYRRSLEERRDWLRSLARAGMEKQKVCPACRALLSARESRCPFCNERVSAFDRVGVKRLFGGLLPASGPRYSTLLLAANFILFGIELLAASQAGVGLESLFGGVRGTTLQALGARDYRAISECWRLLTAVFLHGNLIHLLFNSLVLYDVGPAVEEMYGGPRFIVLYLAAGVAGSLASFFYDPYRIMVGASGALFGLIGVMIAYGYRHRTALGEHIKSMYVRWAIFGLLYGFVVPGVDNAAHVGGLLAGLAYGALVSDTPSFRHSSIVAWRVAQYLGLLLLAISFLLVGLHYGRAS